MKPLKVSPTMQHRAVTGKHDHKRPQLDRQAEQALERDIRRMHRAGMSRSTTSTTSTLGTVMAVATIGLLAGSMIGVANASSTPAKVYPEGMVSGQQVTQSIRHYATPWVGDSQTWWYLENNGPEQAKVLVKGECREVGGDQLLNFQAGQQRTIVTDNKNRGCEQPFFESVEETSQMERHFKQSRLGSGQLIQYVTNKGTTADVFKAEPSCALELETTSKTIDGGSSTILVTKDGEFCASQGITSALTETGELLDGFAEKQFWKLNFNNVGKVGDKGYPAKIELIKTDSGKQPTDDDVVFAFSPSIEDLTSECYFAASRENNVEPGNTLWTRTTFSNGEVAAPAVVGLTYPENINLVHLAFSTVGASNNVHAFSTTSTITENNAQAQLGKKCSVDKIVHG